MKKIFLKPAVIAFILIGASGNAFSQKKKISKESFIPTSTTKVNFTPYKVSDFTSDPKRASDMITLPNKKKVKLSDYVNALNTLEGNLSAMGFAKDRQQKTIIASRFKKADFSRPLTNTVLPAAAAKPKSAVINTKFSQSKFSGLEVKNPKITERISAMRAVEVNALPNEKFDRTHHLTPAPLKNGDYAAKLDVTYYLKGELDPFFIQSHQLRNDSISKMMKETTSFFTAGMNISIMADIPEVGNITAYKLESEYTARSNKTKKHSSKTKLTVMQQVIINENNQNRSGDASSYSENELYNMHKLIGTADVFTYGLNLLMPVDFYMSASSIGANVEVNMTRSGISGSIGPRAAQSVFLETSVTEMVGPFGEGFGNVVDVGVGGELRLIEGGFDYGFAAGLSVENGRLAFVNDMQGELDLEFLRGRLFTFYQYPVFKCGAQILRLGDIECWEMRRVENDLFNTGAALKFEKSVVNEDRSAYVKW